MLLVARGIEGKAGEPNSGSGQFGGGRWILEALKAGMTQLNCQKEELK